MCYSITLYIDIYISVARFDVVRACQCGGLQNVEGDDIHRGMGDSGICGCEVTVIVTMWMDDHGENSQS